MLQWRSIRSPLRRTAALQVLPIVEGSSVSRGSWRVLYYYRIFSITTRRNPCYYTHRLKDCTAGRRQRSSFKPQEESAAVYYSAFCVRHPCLCPLRQWNIPSSAAQVVFARRSIDRPSQTVPQAPLQATAGVKSCVFDWQGLYSQCILCEESLPVSLQLRNSVQSITAGAPTAPQEPFQANAGVGTSVAHWQGLYLQCILSVESVPVTLQVWNPHRTQ